MLVDSGEGRVFCHRRNMEYNGQGSQQGEPLQLDSILRILPHQYRNKDDVFEEDKIPTEPSIARGKYWRCTTQLCFPSDEPGYWNPWQCSRLFLVLGKATQLDHLQSCGFERSPG